MDIYELRSDVRAELRTWREENPDADENEVGDEIWELADSHVPTYNSDCMEVAQDSDIFCRELENPPERTATPLDCVRIAIYEDLEEELWDEWRTIQQEEEDAATEEEIIQEEADAIEDEDNYHHCQVCDDRLHIDDLAACKSCHESVCENCLTICAGCGDSVCATCEKSGHLHEHTDDEFYCDECYAPLIS